MEMASKIKTIKTPDDFCRIWLFSEINLIAAWKLKILFIFLGVTMMSPNLIAQLIDKEEQLRQLKNKQIMVAMSPGTQPIAI